MFGMSIYGKAFDYGRYRGQYALSSGGRTITGPNVLKKRTVTHPAVQKEFERKGISRFKVNVPKELDKAIAKKFNDLFNKEFAKQFPKDIQKSVGQQLKPWDRYSGTDWTPFTDNCIRFTIDTIKETMMEYISQNLDIEGKKDLIFIYRTEQ